MKNEEKLTRLKAFLDANNIEYAYPKNGALHSLRITEYGIHIHVSDENDCAFYEKYKHLFPVFVRDEDSAEFVIEKVLNTIVRVLHARQKKYNRKKKNK